MRALFLILLLPYALGAACVSYLDCPLVDCPGHARQCIGNECVDAPCLAPENIEARENVESFQEAVSYFEEGINLSQRTRNPNAVKNSIIGSLGLQGVLMLMLKGMSILMISMIAMLLFVLAKNKGILKYLIGGVLLVAVGIGAYAMTIGFGSKGIGSFMVDDFIEGDYYSVRDDQLSYLSPFLIDGALYRMDRAEEETTATILEMQSSGAIRSAMIDTEGLPLEIMGEEARVVMTSPKRIIFDEDRFIFIVTGDKAEEISKEIIASYPREPASSILFLKDTVPPRIFALSPKAGEYTNANIITFFAEDNESGIKAISSRNLAAQPECRRNGYAAECLIKNGLREGQNNYIIEAYDTSGNSVQALGTVILDSAAAVFESSVPVNNGYTNKKTWEVSFKDQVSGIGNIDVLGYDESCTGETLITCAFDAVPQYGKNTALIETTDKAGNSKTYEYTVYFDDKSPEIRTADGKLIIEDESGIKRLLVDSIETACSGTRCTVDGTNHDIIATDMAGNTANY